MTYPQRIRIETPDGSGEATKSTAAAYWLICLPCGDFRFHGTSSQMRAEVRRHYRDTTACVVFTQTEEETTTNLARRAVACARWRWMPGMLTDDGTRLPERLPHKMLATLPVLPDLTDPATVGCLLALVRETHGGAVAYRCRRVRFDLEAEALVAALEAPNA